MTRRSTIRSGEGRDHDSGSDFIVVGLEGARLDDIELSGATAADQDFIAHARQDVPLLLEEIDRLRRFRDLFLRKDQRTA